MSECTSQPTLIVASESELLPTDRVWGTGGWAQPEDREALDWLTLARLMGWGVKVRRWTTSGCDAGLSDETRWVVIACNPDSLRAESVAQLAAWLTTEAIVVIARAGTAGEAFARLAGASRRPEQVTGRSLCWMGPGPERRWYCRKALDASALELSEGVLVLGNP